MFRRGTKLSNKISKMRAYGFFQPIGQTAIPGLNFAFSSIQTNEAFVLVIEVPVAVQSFFKCKTKSNWSWMMRKSSVMEFTI